MEISCGVKVFSYKKKKKKKMENLRVFMVINGVAKCFFFFFEVLFFTVPVWKNGVEELLQWDQGAAQSCEADAFHQLCEECI